MVLDGKEEDLVQSNKEAFHFRATIKKGQGTQCDHFQFNIYSVEDLPELLWSHVCCNKDKRRRWACRLLKMKELGPSSPRERLPWQLPEPSTTSVPVTVATDTSELRQIPSNGETAYPESSKSHNSASVVKIPHQHNIASEASAAIKVQAAFRGYLVSLFKMLYLDGNSTQQVLWTWHIYQN